MGTSKKSRDRRSDKQTQSPMLKIFKDMMQKEKIDPEKAKLLKEKHKDKKRKHYSEIRSKSDQDKKRRQYSEIRSKSDQRSYDSSSTDKYRHNINKMAVHDIKEEKSDSFGRDRSRSEPFRGEKRESWWFWGDNDTKKRADTCSCVSCALKKVVGSECVCITCLLLMFSVSVVVVFMMVFNTMPTTPQNQESVPYGVSLDKKIEQIKEKRQLNEDSGLGDYRVQQKWDNTLKGLSSFASFLPSDFQKVDYRGLNSLENMDADLSEDLSNVLDKDKMEIESQNSEKLRDFFKKLIETDTIIRRLKDITHNNYKNDDLNTLTRFKRSARRRPKYFHLKRHENSNDYKDNLYSNTNNKRNKRHKKNNSTKVSGYVIEEEKIFVRYEPATKRVVTKCPHDIDANSHEKQLKHPFYKHSQRLDDMLKGFRKIDTTIQTVKGDDKSTQADTTFSDVVMKSKEENLPSSKITSNVEENEKPLYDDKTKNIEDYNYDINEILSTSPVYDFTISVSTFLNTEKDVPKPHINLGTFANRKLMQVEEEDDVIEYQDLKEVLADDQQCPDDAERESNRKKRDEPHQDASKYISLNKYNPQNMYNPNWKGPMPLYPDELDSMIKQAALQNLNFEIPVNTKDSKSEKDNAENVLSDTQYLEEYMDNKYDKMVKVAQAYSDYGVLYGKKDGVTTGELKDHTTDHRLKSLWEGKKYNIGRFYKASNGAEIGRAQGKFPYHQSLFKKIQKHFYISHTPKEEGKPVNTDFGKIYTTIKTVPTVDTTQNHQQEKHAKFSLSKVLRSLKSVEPDDENRNESEIANKTQINLNNSTMDVFSFLSVMADWFKNMAILSGELNTIVSFNTTTASNISRTNTSKNNATNLILKENSSEITYPSYDSDMIENIGHRSRVLLSVEDPLLFSDTFIGNETETVSPEENSFESPELNDSVIPVAIAIDFDSANISDTETQKSKKENKTVVKRNVDNVKFTNWNNLYDDIEYGVKMDYLDNVQRNEHSPNIYKSAFSKSKNWIQGKVQNMTNKFHRTGKNKSKNLNKITKSKISTEKYLQSKKEPKLMKKREVKNGEYDDGSDLKSVFEALTAKMKKVCHEAAQAVRNTRKVEGQGVSTEDAAATSLMQRLVRLMSDLVDIQVQQKTCAKLPPDLRNFLEWLTAPAEASPHVDNLNPGLTYYFQGGDEESSRFGKSTNNNVDLLAEDSNEDRTECLGTIRAVQDLIQQYEGMTDEVKSKMTGVREYLENQLTFLNKKLNDLDETNIYKMYEKRDLRQKRNAYNEIKDKDKIKNDHPKKKGHHCGFERLRKLFRRKHIKSTTKATIKSTVPSKAKEVVTGGNKKITLKISTAKTHTEQKPLEISL